MLKKEYGGKNKENSGLIFFRKKFRHYLTPKKVITEITSSITNKKKKFGY